MREPHEHWPSMRCPDGAARSVTPRDWPVLFPMPDLSDCLAFRHHDRPWLLTIWEPLDTKAPSPARALPHCCLLDTVIFYHRPYIVGPPRPWRDRKGVLHPSSTGSFVEYGRATMRLCRTDLITFEGQAFERFGGRVLWRRRRWWAVYGAHRGTRPARQANRMPDDGPSWPEETAHA